MVVRCKETELSFMNMTTFDKWNSIVCTTAANSTELALSLDQKDFMLIHFNFFHPVKRENSKISIFLTSF